MPLGALGLKKCVFALVIGLWATFSFVACGSARRTAPTSSGLSTRALASQGVSAGNSSGGVVILNGFNDTIPAGLPAIGAGTSPGLMTLSPSRNIAAVFDSVGLAVYAINTTTEKNIGPSGVHLPGVTQSMVVPNSDPVGYAAVPNASITGFSFSGAIAVMSFATGGLNLIAVPSAQTVVANSTGSQLLVFSNDSDSLTLISPGAATPPVDTSCITNPNNGICTVIPGFNRPVFAIVQGNIAYFLNCGLQCGGAQPASVAIFDLTSLTVKNLISVDAATDAFLTGSTLYVAGTSPANNACTGQKTAATSCGRLDVVDLNSGTVTGTYVITDGYHWRMDMTANGQLFVGSRNCTNIGNVNIGGGEIRGCLTILDTVNNRIISPGDNGDVDGLVSFTSRQIEWVAQGGNLRVYTTYGYQDGLLLDGYLQFGTINIVGYVGDVKRIDSY